MHNESIDARHQDEQAVRAVRLGDTERYRELVERHARRVYAVAWSRLGDAALAEEVTQEAFIRAYRRLWLLADGANFAAWLGTIARRLAINLGLRHRRELNRRQRWALEQLPAHDAPASADEAEPPCPPETLRQTLAELPGVHRECLVLFYLEGRSGADAAAALGISEATLRVRLHRARAALRAQLEAKLAHSLERLRPTQALVPVVMAGVLASASAQAATAGGGGAALLGTLIKCSPLKWLVPFSAAVIGALPGLALSALAARAEQRNFREPEGFRAQASRASHLTMLWVVPLVTLPVGFGALALIWTLGPKRADWILAAFMVSCLAWAWRMLGTGNRFHRGLLIWYGLLGGGMALKAVGLLSANAYTYWFIAASLWLAWIVRWRPTRRDHSLFFRATMGLLEDALPAAPAPQPTTRLERTELGRFGAHLASRHLVHAVHWRPEGLLLRQRFPTLPWPATWAARFKSALPFSPRDSAHVLLHWNGEVTARCSEADERRQRALEPDEAAARTAVQTQVATAVMRAWHAFRQGHLEAADRALGERPESEIFHVSPARAASTRWLQLTAALPAVLFGGMEIAAHYPQLLHAVKTLLGRHP